MSDTSTPDPVAYTAENIQVLHDLEHIRRRPAMYIGSCGSAGLQHLVEDWLTEAIEQTQYTQTNLVHIDLLPNNGLRVRDFGPGLPVEWEARLGKHLLEAVFTELFVGGHGLPPWPLLSALAARLEVAVYRDGRLWEQTFAQGRAVSELRSPGITHESGTCVTFWPDPSIFTADATIEPDWLANRLREIASLFPGLSIRLTNRRCQPPTQQTFRSENGLSDLLASRVQGLVAVHPTLVRGALETADGQAQVVFGWFEGPERVWSYHGRYQTQDGGTHVAGLRQGLARIWQQRLSKGARKDGQNIPIAEACRVGLTAIVQVQLQHPSFHGARKDTLINPEAEDLVASLVRQCLEGFLHDHPDEAKAIARHIATARGVDPKTGMP